jgi:hypothetical protein
MKANFTVSSTAFRWVEKYGIWYGEAEASTLGMKPGYWPHWLDVQGRKETKTFVQESWDSEKGAVYVSDGFRLTVFND